MPHEEKPQAPARWHSLSLEGREKLSITGVDDVTGFDEGLVVLKTGQGELSVRGQELHIERIDLDSGVLELHGRVQELSYDEPVEGRGLWARLFG